ncbi:UNVERIFIED_CONTAM: hypothetical protein FKN15_050699 [Acipenser sinensis]
MSITLCFKQFHSNKMSPDNHGFPVGGTTSSPKPIKKWRLERGLPEREPNELELLIQRWEELAREALWSPAPEELVLRPEQEEESFPEPEKVEPLPSLEPLATDKGEEPTAFFSHCGLTMQPPKSYSVEGQRSSQAAYRQAYRGRWCAVS